MRRYWWVAVVVLVLGSGVAATQVGKRQPGPVVQTSRAVSPSCPRLGEPAQVYQARPPEAYPTEQKVWRWVTWESGR
jgi:hypothetical protein